MKLDSGVSGGWVTNVSFLERLCDIAALETTSECSETVKNYSHKSEVPSANPVGRGL